MGTVILLFDHVSYTQFTYTFHTCLQNREVSSASMYNSTIYVFISDSNDRRSGNLILFPFLTEDRRWYQF
jgi:hypothetical protein